MTNSREGQTRTTSREGQTRTTSGGRRLTGLSPRRYRWVDRATKLAGVGLVGAGLNAGGSTPTGVAFALLGVALGLATVLFDKQ